MKTKDDLASLYDSADAKSAVAPACRPASWRRSSIAPRDGAMFQEMALTAGSSSSGSGAFTPTKKSSERRLVVIAGIVRSSIVCHKTNARREAGHNEHRSNRENGSALPAQPHDHVDAADLVTLRHVRHFLQHQMRIRNVDQLVIVLEIEVVVRGDVGVEIGFGAVDADLPQKSGSVNWLSVL